MTAMVASLLNEIVSEGLYLVLLLSAPIIAVALLSSIIVGLLAHYTRLNEPAIGTLSRLIAVLAGLLAISPWIGRHAVQFAEKTLQLLQHVVS